MSARSTGPSLNELSRLLTRLIADATKALNHEDRTLDGHYRPAVATLKGLRVSVRFNRAKRREVCVSAAKEDGQIYIGLAEKVSEAHQKVTGHRLKVAYADPLDYARADVDHLTYAVMHIVIDGAQGGLGLNG